MNTICVNASPAGSLDLLKVPSDVSITPAILNTIAELAVGRPTSPYHFRSGETPSEIQCQPPISPEDFSKIGDRLLQLGYGLQRSLAA